MFLTALNTDSMSLYFNELWQMLFGIIEETILEVLLKFNELMIKVPLIGSVEHEAMSIAHISHRSSLPTIVMTEVSLVISSCCTVVSAIGYSIISKCIRFISFSIWRDISGNTAECGERQRLLGGGWEAVGRRVGSWVGILSIN
jgi:hypothetical protein